MDREAWLEKLFALERKGIKLGLEPTRQLLDRCGNPQRAFQSIQIAGTNGKGSTAAMTAAILQQHGHRTGLYTSPHLLRFNERIRVDGKTIPDDYLVDWMARHAGDIESLSTTFFEATTAMALCYFRDRGVAWALLETGLGGRLDAVTAAESAWTALSPIAMDHVDILGPTLADIAFEKTAIMRAGVPCIVAPQEQAAQAVIRRQAEKSGARLRFLPPDPIAPAPRHLPGDHQQGNANLAWALAVDALGTTFVAGTARAALETVRWPGRYQRLADRPAVIYDVAHNLHGLKAVLDTFKREPVTGRRWAVLALQEDKGSDDILDLLAPAFDHLIITETGIRRYLPAGKLAGIAATLHPSVALEPDPARAIQKAVEQAAAEDLIAILGSHYLGPAVAAFFKISFDI